MKRYTEADAQAYYDQQDILYKQCWAADGTTHWGYFADNEVADLQEAGWLWTKKVLEQSEITKDSKVLEIGCGNGAVAIWLARQTGCAVTGIDISGVRIDNANQEAAAHPELDVTFVCGTITDLPFEDGMFTHVWGQGVLYHIPDLDKALSEVSRVLARGGIVLIDDFVRPEVAVSDPVRRHFYDRLKFDAKYTHGEYLRVMQNLQLTPVETLDMTDHIGRTYELVTSAAESVDEDVATAFRVSGHGTQTREVVGYFYKCVKVTDPVQWIYESKSVADIEARYDVWAPSYDKDLGEQYVTPARAVQQLSEHVADKATSILDVGCGTGLMGLALAKAGYTNVHGIDLSQKMLEIAEQKQCYASLSQHNLLVDADVATYSAIVSAGCITFEHVPGYALARIFSWLAPGGVFHFTVRQDFVEKDLYCNAMLHGLRWDLVDSQSWSIHSGDQKMLGLVLKKHLS